MSDAHDEQHDDHGHGNAHTGDVNIGLLVTLFIAGVLFLTAFLFFMVGFFDYMAYQGRIEKVVNRPSPAMQLKAQQASNLHGGAEIDIDQAMKDIVTSYKAANSSD